MTTSLLENAVILETIKKEGTLRWRHLTYPHSKAHAPCLSGRRPSSAVHHFGPIHLHLLIPRGLGSYESLSDTNGKDPHAPRLQFHSSRLKERDVAEQFKKRVEALSKEKTPDMALLLSQLNGKSLFNPRRRHPRRTQKLRVPCLY